jgi:hypothetical protein
MSRGKPILTESSRAIEMPPHTSGTIDLLSSTNSHMARSAIPPLKETRGSLSASAMVFDVRGVFGSNMGAGCKRANGETQQHQSQDRAEAQRHGGTSSTGPRKSIPPWEIGCPPLRATVAGAVMCLGSTLTLSAVPMLDKAGMTSGRWSGSAT